MKRRKGLAVAVSTIALSLMALLFGIVNFVTREDWPARSGGTPPYSLHPFIAGAIFVGIGVVGLAAGIFTPMGKSPSS